MRKFDVRLVIDIDDPKLAPLANKLLAQPIAMMSGDILKLNYGLHIAEDVPNTLKNIAIVIELLKSPRTSVRIEDYHELVRFHDFVSKLKPLLNELEAQIALSDVSAQRILAQRLGNPNHQPTEVEQTFLNTILKRNDQ